MAPSCPLYGAMSTRGTGWLRVDTHRGQNGPMAPVAVRHEAPSELAEQALTSIAKILHRRRISAREVCRRLGEQHTWLSKRFAGEHALSLSDVDRIAAAINEDPADLLGFPQTPLARRESREVDEIRSEER